jgi:hypothetical protein
MYIADETPLTEGTAATQGSKSPATRTQPTEAPVPVLHLQPTKEPLATDEKPAKAKSQDNSLAATSSDNETGDED